MNWREYTFFTHHDQSKRYAAVFLVFLAVFLYQLISFQLDQGDKNKKEKKEPDSVPALESRKPEAIYKDALHSKKNDVFRLGFLTRVDFKQNIEIYLQNALSDTLKIHQMEILPSDNWQFQEVVFVTPDRYNSIVMKLKDHPTRPDEWDNKKVFIDSLFVTRLNTSENEISQLQPTVFGVGNIQYARLEDLGDTLLYTFSLRGKKVDYESLDSKSKSIRFDTKEDVVTGSRKHGEYFMYKFDTLNPFEKLVIQATRKGVPQDGIRLEYSYDKSFWKEIVPPNDLSGTYKFTQTIPGKEGINAVYLRVIYLGDEKRKSTFSLKELTVFATVMKPQ